MTRAATEDKTSDPAEPLSREATNALKQLEAAAGRVDAAKEKVSSAQGDLDAKVLAAKRAARSGADTVIAWGREPDVLLRLARGEAIGTWLQAKTAKLTARKQWMADHLQLRGAVTVDAGACAKLLDEGKSLLPVGVVAVEGQFARGDVIAVRAPDGREVARGLANYAAGETRMIARKPSSQIDAVLGYSNGPELIHRDNMVRS